MKRVLLSRRGRHGSTELLCELAGVEVGSRWLRLVPSVGRLGVGLSGVARGGWPIGSTGVLYVGLMASPGATARVGRWG